MLRMNPGRQLRKARDAIELLGAVCPDFLIGVTLGCHLLFIDGSRSDTLEDIDSGVSDAVFGHILTLSPIQEGPNGPKP
jgi:hypothetical protein